jgi:hypothetical protein
VQGQRGTKTSIIINRIEVDSREMIKKEGRKGKV